MTGSADPVAGHNPYRVVFQLDDDSARRHGALLQSVANTVAELGAGTSVLVVAHGPGVRLLTGATGFAEQLADLRAHNVAFAACAKAMSHQEIPASALLPGVDVVSAGVAEVVRRQHQGWAYVRA